MRCAAMIQPSFAKVTTIYLIIINLYAVFKMKRLFYLWFRQQKRVKAFQSETLSLFLRAAALFNTRFLKMWCPCLPRYSSTIIRPFSVLQSSSLQDMLFSQMSLWMPIYPWATSQHTAGTRRLHETAQTEPISVIQTAKKSDSISSWNAVTL